MNKLVLGLLIGALVAFVLFSKFQCGDSQESIDHSGLKKQVEDLQFALQISQSNYEIERNKLESKIAEQDSIIAAKDTRLKRTGGEIMHLSTENKRLKLANDTIGRLHNCDQVYELIDSFAIQLAEKDTALKYRDIDIQTIIQFDAEQLDECNKANNAMYDLILEYQRKVDSFNAAIQVPVRKKGKITVALRPGFQLGGYYGPDGVFRPGAGIGINLFPERKK
jgi:hypothetical protein